MVHIVALFDSLAQASVFPTAPDTYQEGGKPQTLATRTPEQIKPSFRHRERPIIELQPIVASGPVVEPALSADGYPAF